MDFTSLVAAKKIAMNHASVHQCECPSCQSAEPHPDQAVHHHINLFLSCLNEPQRRWFVALEALRAGRGGKHLLAQITGMSPTTILRGCRELEAELVGWADSHLRAPGGGRPTVEQLDPGLEAALKSLLESETAGDPMGQRPKAKRSLLQHLSAALKQEGHSISRPTVSKLLRKLKYSPKVNARRVEVRGASAAQRHAQFDHINEQREAFSTTEDPIISVDTKKRVDWQFQECRPSLAQVRRAGVGA